MNKDTGKTPSSLHYKHTEVWLSDFGSHELEQELVESVRQLKPATRKNPSWIFMSLLIIVFVLAAEIYIRQIGGQNYWSELTTFWVVWLFRLILLVVWVYLAGARWQIRRDKLLIITLIGFTVSVIGSAVIKIWTVPSTWSFLNLLVEPIWMLLLSGLSVSIFIKINNKK